MTGLVPAIVAVLGVIGATLTYLIQRRVEWLEDQRRRKQDVYVDYLDALSEFDSAIPVHASVEGSWAQHRTAIKNWNHYSNRLKLFASEEVTSALVEANVALANLNHFAVTHDSKPLDRDLLVSYSNSRTHLVDMMREDLFGDKEKVGAFKIKRLWRAD